MRTTTTTTDLRQQLQVVEDYLARLLEHVAKIEGERDSLIRQLADSEGCHDQRFCVR